MTEMKIGREICGFRVPARLVRNAARISFVAGAHLRQEPRRRFHGEEIQVSFF